MAFICKRKTINTTLWISHHRSNSSQMVMIVKINFMGWPPKIIAITKLLKVTIKLHRAPNFTGWALNFKGWPPNFIKWPQKFIRCPKNFIKKSPNIIGWSPNFIWWSPNFIGWSRNFSGWPPTNLRRPPLRFNILKMFHSQCRISKSKRLRCIIIIFLSEGEPFQWGS